MKIIVTHKSCDLDGITSAWLLKQYLPGWNEAQIQFVPAGNKLPGNYLNEGDVIEILNGDEVIHVDTGLTPLDHHQVQDTTVSAASLTFDYIKKVHHNDINLLSSSKFKAIERIVKYIVDTDHFKEIFWPDPASDTHEFSLIGLSEGMRYQYPLDDIKNSEFLMVCLDALVHTFENKIWAEEEIAQKGIEFETKWGKALAVETHNDTVLKLAQKMGYIVVVRKDPSNGAVRIKAKPTSGEADPVDLTPIYEIIRQKDPEAHWFLHISKKMLLNGSSKNPQMKASVLNLQQLVEILKNYK